MSASGEKESFLVALSPSLSLILIDDDELCNVNSTIFQIDDANANKNWLNAFNRSMFRYCFKSSAFVNAKHSNGKRVSL